MAREAAGESPRADSHRGAGEGSTEELSRAHAENPLAHPPEGVRLQLQTDQEQHHDHAELGEVHDVLPLFADEPEQERADHDPGGEVAQDRAHAQFLRDGHAGHRGGEIDDGLEKGVGHGLSTRRWPRPDSGG